MSTYSYPFVVTPTKTLHCNADGSGSINFTGADFPIPAGSLPNGLPNNLGDLIRVLNVDGTDNVTMEYYVAASGMLSGWDCWRTVTLYTTGTLSDGTNSSSLQMFQDSTGYGVPIPPNFQSMFASTNKLLTKLITTATDVGSGSGCAFEKYGGWSKAQIQISVTVTVNLAKWCASNPAHKAACNDVPPGPPVSPPTPPPSRTGWSWWIWLIIILIILIILITLGIVIWRYTK